MRKILKYCFNTSVWQPTRLEWINLLCSLGKEERDRVSSYMFKRDCKQTLIGQVLIRFCLKNLLATDCTNLVLDRNSKGRPCLKLPKPEQFIDFNLSHAGDYTIIVAGIFENRKKSDDSDEGPRIGTDVMKIDFQRSKAKYPEESDEENLFRNELILHERVINSKFSTNEKNYIYNRPNPVEKLTAFYRLWCLKESYVKAIGDGISFDLKRIECLVNSELLIDLNSKKYLVANDSQLFVDGKIAKNCKFYEQYFMDTLETTSRQERPKLHIMTFCIVENEKSSKSAEILDIMTEFSEISLKDILAVLIPLDKIDEKNNEQEFENLWLKFNQKDEKPLL